MAERILRRVANLVTNLPRPPGLAVLLVGRDPASELYVRLKRQTAKRLGFGFRLKHYPETPPLATVLRLIKRWNDASAIDGILVQLPLPRALPIEMVMGAIAPQKDVDGFHPRNKLIEPVLPQAVMRLIKTARPRPGSRAVVLARSPVFGQMMTSHLMRAGYRANFLVCAGAQLSRPAAIALKQSVIIVSALGQPGILRSESVGPRAIVIDAGIKRRGGKVWGDAAPTVRTRAGFLTPVPGGVGPVTIACLFYNLARLARASKVTKRPSSTL